jgi:hypothetical protein
MSAKRKSDVRRNHRGGVRDSSIAKSPMAEGEDADVFHGYSMWGMR